MAAPELVDGHTLIADMLAGADQPTTASGPPAADIRFTVKKFVLGVLLDKAAAVVPTRDVMPVLKNFQVTATPGRLRVVASDMELSMVVTTEIVDVAAAGTAVFPARKLLDIVRQADDGEVHVRVAGRAASITIGRTTWNLKLAGGDDFPAMPAITEVVMHTVDRAAFAAALASVRYAACRDAARANLMIVDVRDGAMIAADGARLGKAVGPDLPFALQIPIDAVDDLLKLLRGSDLPEVSIGEAGHRMVFRLGADVFIVNKLMAQFPDMEAQLLRPALANTAELRLDRTDLLKAIRRVRINADASTSAIALILRDGTLTVTAKDSFGNDANETITASWTGGERTLVVNHGYLTDIITAHGATRGDDTLHFYLGTDTRSRKAPLLLRDPHAGTVGVVQQMLSDWISG